MRRRAQKIEVKIERNCGGERTAVGKVRGRRLLRAVLLAGLPDNPMTRKPSGEDRQSIEKLIKAGAASGG
jgi:hypothetical protein